METYSTSDNDKSDISKLLNLLKIKYGFKGFYHYTDYSNLRGMFEVGALECRNNIKTTFHDAANQNVLAQAPSWIHDQVRLFYFPTTPFLYNIEGIKPKRHDLFGEMFGEGPHMPRPVALLFSEDVAYMDGIKFCDGSASYLLASNEEHITRIEKHAKNAIDFNWCLISSRGPIPSRYGSVNNVCGETCGPTITNHRNAEILVPNKLPLSYLTSIIFRSEADKKQAVSEFGCNKLYRVHFGTFNNKNSYLYDYELTWAKGSDHIHIELELFPIVSLDRYKHCMKLYSGNKLRREEIFNLRYRHESINLYDCDDITKIEYYMDDTKCAVWEAISGNY